MRIAFLCGSLEPGKDGVGDYTRRLACELSKRGHTVIAIALNDGFIQAHKEDIQNEEGIQVSILRLPCSIAWKTKLQYLSNFVKKFDIEWFSLQYVPYAFHPKGLPFNWIGFFKKLSGNYRWHIMMHELWIGGKKEDVLKDKVIGFFQRQIIASTIRAIRPKAISTSLAFYRDKLGQLGFNSEIHPVFSNLPVGIVGNMSIQDFIIGPHDIDFKHTIVSVFFGTVHKVPGLVAKVKELNNKIEQEGKKLLIVHIGRSQNINSVFAEIKSSTKCECVILGEKNAEEISAFFKLADIGLSTYGNLFLGKSGSIAAMLNNGLPVILLHQYPDDTTVTLPYARYISEIELVTDYSKQTDNFSVSYGLADTAFFYERLLMK